MVPRLLRLPGNCGSERTCLRAISISNRILWNSLIRQQAAWKGPRHAEITMRCGVRPKIRPVLLMKMKCGPQNKTKANRRRSTGGNSGGGILKHPTTQDVSESKK